MVHKLYASTLYTRHESSLSVVFVFVSLQIRWTCADFRTFRITGWWYTEILCILLRFIFSWFSRKKHKTKNFLFQQIVKVWEITLKKYAILQAAFYFRPFVLVSLSVHLLFALWSFMFSYGLLFFQNGDEMNLWIVLILAVSLTCSLSPFIFKSCCCWFCSLWRVFFVVGSHVNTFRNKETKHWW